MGVGALSPFSHALLPLALQTETERCAMKNIISSLQSLYTQNNPLLTRKFTREINIDLGPAFILENSIFLGVTTISCGFVHRQNFGLHDFRENASESSKNISEN